MIRTGVKRFERSFLCMQRKLTSDPLRTFFRTLNATGMAEMKATSFLDVVARTPTCHSFLHPGERSALYLLGSVLGLEFEVCTYHLRNDTE